ncbi:GntR family transcriptional regulator [Oricola sp.]|uniref:GntR family transcriptional regulator n=1 Tax=Oricola sp. TaxID=1979950 RepID=UPI0025F0C7C0|nr:GntR family transcriptional regulator [Oricola sp.]MCI5077119.1 GntR family transcriptional regulator [Oricola sp.]
MADQTSKGGSLPLYLQISELLSREIAAGLWPDGSRLPTEAELAGKLGVAIGTLRKALALLEKRGLLERIQGSGTYVRRKGKAGSIYEFFHLELKQGVGLPTAEVLSLDLCDTPEFLPAFGDGRSKQAWRVRRMRRLGGVPAALEEIWFDARHAPDLKIADMLESLHYFYRERLGFWIARVEDKVSVSPCPDFGPSDGPFTPGAPFGFVERVSWGNADTIEEYSRNWFDLETVCYSARWV